MVFLARRFQAGPGFVQFHYLFAVRNAIRSLVKIIRKDVRKIVRENRNEGREGRS